MVYSYSSFLLGTFVGLAAVALMLAIARRTLAPLVVCATAGGFAALVFFLAAKSVGELIDLRVGVIWLGDAGRPRAGLHWTWVAIGGGVALCVSLLAAWLNRREDRDPAVSQLPWILGWGLLGLVVAVVLSQRARMEDLTRSVAGLREIASHPDAYQFRTMPSPLPVMSPSAFEVEPVVEGLDMPASFAFLPDGNIVIGQVDGTILSWNKEAQTTHRLHKLEGLESRGETGLLDIELAPGYPEEPYLYVYYTTANYGSNRLTRFRFEDDKLTDEEVIVDKLPAGHFHNGGALTFGTDGMLYFNLGEANYKSVGEHYMYPEGTQGWNDPRGNIMRIHPDGSIPEDNPRRNAPAYAIGTREVFRMAVDPLTSRIFFAENGATEDDEINVLIPGGNYGHPLVTGLQATPGFEEPVLSIPKPLGITGLAFYDGERFPEEYRYDLFFGSWNTGSLYWLPLDRDPSSRMPRAPVVEIRPADPQQGCYLDVQMGPDGYLYYSNQQGIFRMNLKKYVPPEELQRQGLVVKVDGRDIFLRYCASCHQLNGSGREGMFPPLAGSQTLLGDPLLPAAVALFGVQSKHNPEANMPSFGDGFTDQQIAAALSYVRSQWGNDGPEVSPATVGQARRAFAAQVGQAKMEKRRGLTVEEMQQVVKPAG